MKYKNVFLIVLSFPLFSFGSVTKWSSSLPSTSKFTPTDELEERVEFWRKIYSEYSTRQGVFHKANDPGFILGEIDLTDIYDNSVLNDATKVKQAGLKIKKE